MDNVKFDLWRKRVQGGEEMWVALRESLRGNASEAVWAAGLNTLRLVDYHDNQIVIGAPNQIQLLRVQTCDGIAKRGRRGGDSPNPL